MLKYMIVTTAKNEASNLERLIKLISKQTYLPSLWLIFNDNSSDNTNKILNKAHITYNYLEYVNLDYFDFSMPWRYDAIMSHGFKKAIEFAEVKSIEWKYIAVLDGDIIVDQNDYFENIISIMEKNEKIGIACGRIDTLTPNGIVVKRRRENRPGGAARVLSRNCLEKIGGYPIAPSSDRVMTDLANRYGYITKRIENIRVLQTRETNPKNGIYKGFGQYYIGNHPITAFLFFLEMLVKKQFGNSIQFTKTYLSCYKKRMPRSNNKDIRDIYKFKF